jgi:hypothetical protein
MDSSDKINSFNNNFNNLQSTDSDVYNKNNYSNDLFAINNNNNNTQNNAINNNNNSNNESTKKSNHNR